MQITRLNLGVSNAYLVRGDGLILVDAGNIGQRERLTRALERHGVSPRDLDLILLTHAHGDHFGDAPLLRSSHGTPIALHPLDHPLLTTGRNPVFHPVGLLAHVIRPLFDYRFTPFEVDITLDGRFTLRDYGIPGEVLHTPGHTAGSVSLVFDDGSAILADLVRGSFVRRDAPTLHLFADDLGAVGDSLGRVLEHDIKTAYFGHGEPASGAAVRRFARRWSAPPHFSR